jgi:hypothetical protein
MSIKLTGTDLNQWSARRSAQGELPAVVRQLIMATAQPARIIFPADEAIARPGVDGTLTVTGDAGPFVPNGDSVWEASTDGNPKGKATRDYTKRTSQTPRTYARRPRSCSSPVARGPTPPAGSRT